jgi:hypothetical protein
MDKDTALKVEYNFNQAKEKLEPVRIYGGRPKSPFRKPVVDRLSDLNESIADFISSADELISARVTYFPDSEFAGKHESHQKVQEAHDTFDSATRRTHNAIAATKMEIQDITSKSGKIATEPVLARLKKTLKTVDLIRDYTLNGDEKSLQALQPSSIGFER